MKRINELIDPQNLTTLESSKCSASELNQTPVLDRLFAVMTAVYGQKFTSLLIDEQMTDDMQKVWGHHLRDVDLDQMKLALDRLPKEYPNWPPTVGQFLELCKACKVTEYNPRLPKPRTEANEQAAFEAFDQLRGILK